MTLVLFPFSFNGLVIKWAILYREFLLRTNLRVCDKTRYRLFIVVLYKINSFFSGRDLNTFLSSCMFVFVLLLFQRITVFFLQVTVLLLGLWVYNDESLFKLIFTFYCLSHFRR